MAGQIVVADTFVRLRWRLLRGAIRHGGAEQVGAIVSTAAAALVGIGGGTAILIAGATADRPDELAVMFCTLVVIIITGLGIVSGISQPIDPRVIAAEPLSDRQRVIGLLASSALGPAGLSAIALGAGLATGMVTELGGVPLISLAVGSWLLSMLLVARTATNLLALLVSRFPRAGQLVVGAAGLVFYGLFQFLPALLGGLSEAGRTRLAAAMSWTPPGQIGRAIAAADDSAARSLQHLLLGTAWIPVLLLAFGWSARRLTLSVRLAGGLDTSDAEATRIGRIARWACGTGPSASIAWRSLLTRFRTPRTALETFTGAGVGLAAVLVPTLLRDSPGSGAVLVGGAIQLAVLFMAGNSFGSDGPALTHEMLAGADTATLVRGKARSIVVVAAPLALLGPLLAAVITGEWRYLIAGFGVGIGGLMAGTGAAIVQSTLVPIAIPESDNPFAGGESGKGMVAALLLGVVLAGLAIVTVPVALGVVLGDRSRSRRAGHGVRSGNDRGRMGGHAGRHPDRQQAAAPVAIPSSSHRSRLPADRGFPTCQRIGTDRRTRTGKRRRATLVVCDHPHPDPDRDRPAGSARGRAGDASTSGEAVHGGAAATTRQTTDPRAATDDRPRIGARQGDRSIRSSDPQTGSTPKQASSTTSGSPTTPVPCCAGRSINVVQAAAPTPGAEHDADPASEAPTDDIAETPDAERSDPRTPRASTIGRMEQDTTLVDRRLTTPTTDSATPMNRRRDRRRAVDRGDLDRRHVRRLLSRSPRRDRRRLRPSRCSTERSCLHPQVALRPEPFGALAYHYDTRRLVFLKHPDVVRVVQRARAPRHRRRCTGGLRHRTGSFRCVRAGPVVPDRLGDAP